MKECIPDIVVGVVLSAHGIRGEIKVYSFTSQVDDLVHWDPLTIKKENSQSDEYKIDAWRVSGKSLLIKLQGINDRDAAQKLVRGSVLIKRSALSDTAENEYYHIDLLGLSVFDSSQSLLGVVRSIQNFGGGDILEIAPTNGNGFFIPFTRKFVPKIDLESKSLFVIIPDAYLDKSHTKHKNTPKK